MQDRVGGAFLHHLAVVHDQDPVGYLRHHGQIVRDVDGGGVVDADDVADGLEHLDLGGDIERRRRLVEHQQLGRAGEGHRQHDALLLATARLGADSASRAPTGLGRSSILMSSMARFLALGESAILCSSSPSPTCSPIPMAGLRAAWAL